MPDYPFDLTDRVAIVTGGGTGIGASTAALLASFGADVVLASRKTENLQRVAAGVREATGRRALAVATDVRDEASVAAMVQATVDTFGRVDILVNNAGGSYMFPLDQTTVANWDNMVSLNLRGPFLCTKEVAPHMARQKSGAIVNISSEAGVNGVKGGAPYSAAKAGLQMLTRVVAAEWGPRGIRCNCIAVGGVASEGALRAWARFGQTPETMGDRVPLRRVGLPEDIAWGIFYFASDMSTWVTGQTLSINGGPVIGGLSDDQVG
jgi:NAD(P)-dependent dehydrogenase (short-subunit alcohol dehydrogenase family)